MKIDQKYWNHTSIVSVLDIFTGKIAESIADLPSKNILRLEKHLPQLFCRWYFLRLSESEDSSPAGLIEYHLELEKWPKGGQILVKPTLRKFSTSDDLKERFAIELDVDYIDFFEQPFISDLIEVVGGGSAKNYLWEDVYRELLEKVAGAIASKKEVENFLAKNDTNFILLIWSLFKNAFFGRWWEIDPFIMNSFKMGEFIDLCEGFLKEAGRKGEMGLGIDHILDVIVMKVRKLFPEWAYNSKELEKRDEIYGSGNALAEERSEKERMKADTFISLGINIYLYFLLPLSSYLNLINPYYMEISHWEEDLGIVLENLETDSLTLAKPAASFKLSQFGEKLFSLLVK